MLRGIQRAGVADCGEWVEKGRQSEGGCGGLWGVGGKGSLVRGRVWRTVGSGGKRVVSQRAGVADCGEWVE